MIQQSNKPSIVISPVAPLPRSPLSPTEKQLMFNELWG
jgi:hypothetical protein